MVEFYDGACDWCGRHGVVSDFAGGLMCPRCYFYVLNTRREPGPTVCEDVVVDPRLTGVVRATRIYVAEGALRTGAVEAFENAKCMALCK